ncbi:hypothetical protein Ahy_B05g075622 [Arachis hypogaea]|uniref:Uncharacterized protein n=1 Tax=Arachis hypogaea TaxID=3818 RepID=A0A444Z1M5_ARAHY|nr:hypothetical protein Ahy_B05g075622 [Arachis hypogaea]
MKVDEITDVIVIGRDELELRHELPDHNRISEEKIPVIGMYFDSLPQTQKFYTNYAKKVRFVTKVKNTNFDKMRKKSNIPINQSIHCTQEGCRKSRVKAVTRANRIIGTRCKERMYVMLDREKESWIVSRLELRHFHPCSVKKLVDYHEYRELTTHAKCVIRDNDEASLRPNKTYLALANEEIPSFEWVFTQWVRCVGTAPREIITKQCKAMAGAIKKVLPNTVYRWCIWHKLKKSQSKLGSYARYRELNAKMIHIVWNSPSDSFDVDWFGFIKKFDLGQNRWLSSR